MQPRPTAAPVADAKLAWRHAALWVAAILLALVAAGLVDVSCGQ